MYVRFGSLLCTAKSISRVKGQLISRNRVTNVEVTLAAVIDHGNMYSLMLKHMFSEASKYE